MPAPLLRWLTASLLTTVALSADVIWRGTPTEGRAVFNNLNFEGAERHSPGSGTILPWEDPLKGWIWRVHKPAADKRAEIRGATGWSDHTGKGGSMEQGTAYYVAWSYRFHVAEPTARGWACFQWKSYPDPEHPETFTQNYPFTMGYNGRELSLTTHGPDWQQHRERVKTIWRHPLLPGEWIDLVLVVTPSLDPTQGYIELHCNGALQTLLPGGTRFYHKTMDGLEVAPKWGAYGGGAIGTEITVDLADLRVGTSLESVQTAQSESVDRDEP